MSVYRVIGRRTFREHHPGDTFEAALKPDQEQRAIKWGLIELVESSIPSIRPGSVTVPEGWLTAREG